MHSYCLVWFENRRLLCTIDRSAKDRFTETVRVSSLDQVASDCRWAWILGDVYVRHTNIRTVELCISTVYFGVV